MATAFAATTTTTTTKTQQQTTTTNEENNLEHHQQQRLMGLNYEFKSKPPLKKRPTDDSIVTMNVRKPPPKKRKCDNDDGHMHVQPPDDTLHNNGPTVDESRLLVQHNHRTGGDEFTGAPSRSPAGYDHPATASPPHPSESSSSLPEDGTASDELLKDASESLLSLKHGRARLPSEKCPGNGTRVGDRIYFYQNPTNSPPMDKDEKMGEIADFVQDGIIVHVGDDNQKIIHLALNDVLRDGFFIWPRENNLNANSADDDRFSDPDGILKVDQNNVVNLWFRRNPRRSREILKECGSDAADSVVGHGDEKIYPWMRMVPSPDPSVPQTQDIPSSTAKYVPAMVGSGRAPSDASRRTASRIPKSSSVLSSASKSLPSLLSMARSGPDSGEFESPDDTTASAFVGSSDAPKSVRFSSESPSLETPSWSLEAVAPGASRSSDLETANKRAHDSLTSLKKKSKSIRPRPFLPLVGRSDPSKQQRIQTVAVEAHPETEKGQEKDLPEKKPVDLGSLIRRPSQEELESCTTKRSRDALCVWYQRYHELTEYKRLNNHCNVPQKFVANEALGIWVNKMRMEKKKFDEGKRSTALSKERVDALDEIGFNWGKSKGDSLWEERLLNLIEYKKMHGHCNVPTKFKKNTSLGRWVSTQRKQYKEMKAGSPETLMTPERAEKLEAIGFRWSLTEREEENSEQKQERKPEPTKREKDAAEEKNSGGKKETTRLEAAIAEPKEETAKLEAENTEPVTVREKKKPEQKRETIKLEVEHAEP